MKNKYIKKLKFNIGQEVFVMFKKTTSELLDFIQKSPSCYHAVDNIKNILDENGFCELSEGKVWELK